MPRVPLSDDNFQHESLVVWDWITDDINDIQVARVYIFFMSVVVLLLVCPPPCEACAAEVLGTLRTCTRSRVLDGLRRDQEQTDKAVGTLLMRSGSLVEIHPVDYVARCLPVTSVLMPYFFFGKERILSGAPFQSARSWVCDVHVQPWSCSFLVSWGCTPEAIQGCCLSAVNPREMRSYTRCFSHATGRRIRGPTLTD